MHSFLLIMITRASELQGPVRIKFGHTAEKESIKFIF